MRSTASRICFFICLLGLGITGIFFVQAADKSKPTSIDWDQPQTITPTQPDILDFLSRDLGGFRQLASDAFKAGKYEDAARYLLFILRHRTDDAVIIYQLACCYGRMGEARLAAKCLLASVQGGFNDMNYIKAEASFEKIRKDTVFAEALNKVLTWGSNLGTTVYIAAPQLIKCRVALPDGFEPNRSYPLLIGLHGRGGNADDFITFRSALDQPGVDVKKSFIMAAPESPYYFRRSFESNKMQYTWDIPANDKETWAKADPLVVAYIREVALQLSRQYKISGVYLLGHSQGVAYAYMAGIKNPDLFKGVIAFAGNYPEKEISAEETARAVKTLRLFIAHGRQDPAIAYAESVKNKDILEKLGYKLTFKSFDGGHGILPDILLEAIQWMLKEKGE